MELQSQQEQEILRVLGQHPIGIKSEVLWSKCESFSDKLELSRALHLMVQRCQVYRRNDLYFLSESAANAAPEMPKRDPMAKYNRKPAAKLEPAAKPEAVAPVAKAAPQPAVNAEDEDEKEAEAASTSQATAEATTKSIIKFGSLQRTRGAGSAALALYKLRGRILTLDDLVEATGTAKTSLYSVMSKLIELGYVECDKQGRTSLYRWSGKYGYPFSSYKPSDDRLLSFRSVLEWDRKHSGTLLVDPSSEDEPEDSEEPEPEAEASSTDSTPQELPVNHLGAVQLIDVKISMLENQIESLRSIRAVLVAA